MRTDLQQLYKHELSTSEAGVYLGIPDLGRGESAIALSIVAQLQTVFFSGCDKS